MDRIQMFLDHCISRHAQIVKDGGTWADEKFMLGKITAIRTIMAMNNETDSVVPANLMK